MNYANEKNIKKTWNRDCQPKRKYAAQSVNGPTIKATGPICPISNIRMGAKDPRATIFLVGNKEIVVNYDALIERCRKLGWDLPKISPGEKLDADIWLISVAKEFVDVDADLETQKQLENIRIFADTLGVKNFISKLRRACR